MKAGEMFPAVPAVPVGALQRWSDAYVHAGWRIQTHAVHGQCQLLDPADRRRAEGSYEVCKSAFERIRAGENIVPPSKHVVLLVHGIARSGRTFSRMKEALFEAGFDAAAISYASTRGTLEGHAETLEALLDRLEGSEAVSFVCHSMGGLVVRHLLARGGAWKRRVTPRRTVLIGTPNRGSAIAGRLAPFPPYVAVFGEAGQQLTPAAVAAVPPLDLPFAVIADGRGNRTGFNPFLKGDNDGTVTVAEAGLEGADRLLVVSAVHALICNHPETVRATVNYLLGGRLEDDLPRGPARKPKINRFLNYLRDTRSIGAGTPMQAPGAAASTVLRPGPVLRHTR